MYYIYKGNKDADQLHGYRATDQRLCFAYAKRRFSNETAQWKTVLNIQTDIQSLEKL